VSRRAPRPVGLAVEALAHSLAPATLLAEVQRAWPAAVGEAVAAAGRPTAERDGVITVSCVSAVWANELDLLGNQLVGSLNEALGRPAVRGVKCKPGAGRA
jgi:predicted nucleic acid-binding Zn ribbon protein